MDKDVAGYLKQFGALVFVLGVLLGLVIYRQHQAAQKAADVAKAEEARRQAEEATTAARVRREEAHARAIFTLVERLVVTEEHTVRIRDGSTERVADREVRILKRPIPSVETIRGTHERPPDTDLVGVAPADGFSREAPPGEWSRPATELTWAGEQTDSARLARSCLSRILLASSCSMS